MLRRRVAQRSATASELQSPGEGKRHDIKGKFCAGYNLLFGRERGNRTMLDIVITNILIDNHSIPCNAGTQFSIAKLARL